MPPLGGGMEITMKSSFSPGKIWRDTEGKTIQAMDSLFFIMNWSNYGIGMVKTSNSVKKGLTSGIMA